MESVNLIIIFVLASVLIGYFYGKNKYRNDVQKNMKKTIEDYNKYLEKPEYTNKIFEENKNKLDELREKINEINELRKKRTDEIVESFKNGNLNGNPSTIFEEDETLKNLNKQEKMLFGKYKEDIKKIN